MKRRDRQRTGAPKKQLWRLWGPASVPEALRAYLFNDKVGPDSADLHSPSEVRWQVLGGEEQIRF